MGNGMASIRRKPQRETAAQLRTTDLLTVDHISLAVNHCFFRISPNSLSVL
jgi:hypothetical protein